MHNTLEKVSAFITREGPEGRELLVFAHQNPLAGIQVPAGTVEPGEALDQAVLRETCEESGLSAVRIVRSFPPFITDLPDGYYALIQPTTFRQEPNDHAPAQDIGLGRGTVFSSGSYLLLRRVVGEWAEVTNEQRDPRSDPPHQLVLTTGWVPAHLLASRLLRTLYHLESLAPTPETWEHLAEGHYIFRFSWLPLVPRPHLVEGQDRWLDRIYESLL